jgi:hypothetical protein
MATILSRDIFSTSEYQLFIPITSKEHSGETTKTVLIVWGVYTDFQKDLKKLFIAPT